jgi:hypothetical protein
MQPCENGFKSVSAALTDSVVHYLVASTITGYGPIRWEKSSVRIEIIVLKRPRLREEMLQASLALRKGNTKGSVRVLDGLGTAGLGRVQHLADAGFCLVSLPRISHMQPHSGGDAAKNYNSDLF